MSSHMAGRLQLITTCLVPACSAGLLEVEDHECMRAGDLVLMRSEHPVFCRQCVSILEKTDRLDVQVALHQKRASAWVIFKSSDGARSVADLVEATELCTWAIQFITENRT